MGRTIRLHDTRTGQVLPVHPRPGNVVGIYSCGPTVYGRIHVGNARPYVVFSLLKRLFVHEGYNVTFVTNITDVNDKIYAAAQTAGVGSEQLAGEMIDAYIADTDRLELGRPDRSVMGHLPPRRQLDVQLSGLDDIRREFRTRRAAGHQERCGQSERKHV